MLRVVALAGLCGVCGCDILFQLQTVQTPAPDAARDAGADVASDAAIPGLVAYFPMEEVEPTFAGCMQDKIGHNDGNCLGALPMIAPGAFGSGYKFDGSLSIQIADSADLNTPTFTVAYWQNIVTDPGNTVQGVECPVNRIYGVNGNDSWQVCPETGGIYWKLDATSMVSGPTLVSGQWHHIAITFDGATAVVWLDGTSIGTGPGPIPIDTSAPIVLGMDIDGGSPSATFDGVLDDLRFYNRALSQEELVSLATRM